MFEKEAEARVRDYIIKSRDCLMQPCKTLEDCKDKELEFDEVVKLVKEGAEFGYELAHEEIDYLNKHWRSEEERKANEWHKADVPTTPINKVVLGYIKDYNTKKFCLVKWNGEWWYDARTWNDKVKLIAWKEIVLPELKESE